MAHHIYHTRGVILGSTPVGESNRFYKIFTEDLGLVGCVAQSVREEKSKLKYELQDYSLITVDLVRGREVWRITSAGAWLPLSKIKSDKSRRKLFAQYCALLSRLIHGEGEDKKLFDEIFKVVDFLKSKVVIEDFVTTFEALVALRVLVLLGYIDPKDWEEFLNLNSYSLKMLQRFEPLRLNAISQINEALHSSHL